MASLMLPGGSSFIMDSCSCACAGGANEGAPSDEAPASPRRASYFMDGKAELEVVESASRVAIHAFFREYKPSKPSGEVDEMIARYDDRGVPPRVLLHLVEKAFTRGRVRKRQSIIFQRRSMLARQLRLENGGVDVDDDGGGGGGGETKEDAGAFASTPPRRGSAFHGLAATPGLFDPTPPPPSNSPATSPDVPSPKYVSPTRRDSVKVGKTLINLSPNSRPLTAAPASPPEVAALPADDADSPTNGKKKKKKKSKKKISFAAVASGRRTKAPPSAPPGHAFVPRPDEDWPHLDEEVVVE